MKREPLIIAVMVLITLAIYLPNLGDRFVNWDLDEYSRVLQGPVDFGTIQAALEDIHGTIVPGYYAPLTSISLMLDRMVLGTDGPNPWFTHLLNVILHCFNGALVYLLTRLVGGSTLCAGVCAFVFLAHPLQVASVSWFAQRKTVLSASFYFLSYLLYLRARPERLWRPYIGSLALFTAGVLTKPVVVTLPVVLFVTELLIPPGRRLDGGALVCGVRQESENAGGHHSEGHASGFHSQWVSTGLKALVWLAPFFAVAVGLGLIGLGSEPTQGLDYPFLARPLIAARTLVFYVLKSLLPIQLQAIYPRWTLNFAFVAWWLPVVVLLAISSALFFYRRRLGPYVFWGLANFVIPFLPASGLVPFGYFQHSFVADHFIYLSMVGFGYLLGRGLEKALTAESSRMRIVALLASSAYCAFMVFQSVGQAMVWKDSISLWSANLKTNPQSWTAHANLGQALLEVGKIPQSLIHVTKALELAPFNVSSHFNLVLCLDLSNRIPEALEAGRKGLEIAPDYPGLHAVVASVLVKAGDLAAAEKHYRRALELKSNYADARNDFGIMLEKAGRVPEAIEQFQLAIRQRPGFALAYNNLGLIYEKSGNLSAAVSLFRKAVTLDPNSFESQSNLGTTLLKAEDVPQALVHLRKAVALQPASAAAHSNLGAALLVSDRPVEAVAHFRKALELQPDMTAARKNLESALSSSPSEFRGSQH